MDIISDIIFWAHVLFIVLAVSTGFFLPLSMILLLVLIHRAHMVVFRGCLFTHLQRMVGGIAAGEHFLQQCAARLFRLDITKKQGRILDGIVSMSPILIALAV